MLKTFNANSPLDWQSHKGTDILRFDTPSGNRSVAIALVTTGRVNVTVAFEKIDHKDGVELIDPILIASADGQFNIGFETAIPAYVQFDAEPGVQISVRGPSRDHMVGKTDEAKFTNLAPETRRNSDLDRIMHLVKINEDRRTEQMAESLKQMRAEQLAMHKEQLEKEQANAVLEENSPAAPETD